MARLPRLAAAGFPHHILQRGNNRAQIFADDEDCERYLSELGVVARQQKAALHAYVLMPNHVHLLLTPITAESISRLMQAVGRRYVAWFNRRHARTGGLFEGRFRSSILDSEHYLLAAVRYIESNPVRGHLVSDPAEYRWSSFRHHAGFSFDPLITEHAVIWGLGNTPFERQAAYRKLFGGDLPDSEVEEIHAAIQQGWALGSPGFLKTLANATARRLSPRPAGRPRRNLSPIKSKPAA